jgi:hypothetical protein
MSEADPYDIDPARAAALQAKFAALADNPLWQKLRTAEREDKARDEARAKDLDAASRVVLSLPERKR